MRLEDVVKDVKLILVDFPVKQEVKSSAKSEEWGKVLEF